MHLEPVSSTTGWLQKMHGGQEQGTGLCRWQVPGPRGLSESHSCGAGQRGSLEGEGGAGQSLSDLSSRTILLVPPPHGRTLGRRPGSL